MFMTASHWSIDQVTDEIVAEAESKFLPMIMDTGVHLWFSEDSMMVVVQFPDAAAGQFIPQGK